MEKKGTEEGRGLKGQAGVKQKYLSRGPSGGWRVNGKYLIRGSTV